MKLEFIKYAFFASLLMQLSLLAQAGSLFGVVTHDGEPLPGVNIIILETQTGAATDINGNYIIKNIPAGKFNVRFSALGYKSRTFPLEIVGNRSLKLPVEMETESIELEEIEVVDDRSQSQEDTRISLLSLSPRNARILPGAVTDVFRSLQSLPGVLAPNDFSSQLIIRGSGPDQNLIIMDDVEVFNPYRLYGVISMFNPEAVKDINLITGGFPARYGDRLSAVLDVTNRQGDIRSDIKGNLNASIVSANLVLEGKNPLSIPGSWLVNTRRTYYDLIIEPFVKNTGLVENNVSFPNFYDVQTKLAFGPFNGHKVFINGIYSRDGVRVISGANRETADSIGVVDISKNDLFSFAWHFAPNNKMLNKTILSWYRNSGDSEFNSELLDPSLDRNDFEDIAPDTLKPYLVGFGIDSDFAFRKYSIDNRFTWLWDTKSELEFGLGYDIMRTTINFDFDIDPQLKSFLLFNPNIRATFENLEDNIDYNRFRAYLSNKFQFGNFFVQPGVRLDYYEIMDKTYLAPRLSMSYALDDLTTFRGVWGIYYQSIGYEKLRDRNRFFNFDRSITHNLEAERATHYVLSVERWISGEWKLKFESYYKKFDGLIEPLTLPGTGYSVSRIDGMNPNSLSGWSQPSKIVIDSVTTVPVNNSYGEAYGLELLLEKRNIDPSGRIDGWLSYSFAYANRYVDGMKLPFRFDQRHTANIVLNYKFNSWLDFGARFQYGSGFPLTEAVGIKPRIILEDRNNDAIPETAAVAVRSTTEKVIFDVDYGDKSNRFGSRKPDYHRLDIRINAKADYWGLDWNFYLDVINVYNHSNVINYDYFVSDEQKLVKEETTMFPILPTLGFNVRF